MDTSEKLLKNHAMRIKLGLNGYTCVDVLQVIDEPYFFETQYSDKFSKLFSKYRGWLLTADLICEFKGNEDDIEAWRETALCFFGAMIDAGDV